MGVESRTRASCQLRPTYGEGSGRGDAGERDRRLDARLHAPEELTGSWAPGMFLQGSKLNAFVSARTPLR